MICNQCNKEMVVREGQYGKFWGCSDFPKCRHTTDYLEESISIIENVITELGEVDDIEEQLKKVKIYNWNGIKQNNELDKKTKFIYKVKAYEVMIGSKGFRKLSLLEKQYAINRWYNFLSAKKTENIFAASPKVSPNLNEYDKLVDFEIEGIKFDHKGTVFPKKYTKSLEFSKNNKANLIRWFYKNQSKQQRYHLSNRIFVVFYSKDGEHWKLKSELQSIKKAVNEYTRNFDRNNLIKIIHSNGEESLSDIIFIEKR